MAFSRLGCGFAIAILAPLTFFAACPQPAWNQARLRAIKGEALALALTHPIKPPDAWREVPNDQLPQVIAKLQPFHVTVNTWGVDIWTKPFFDGGWGYHVPSSGNAADLPMPQGCYSEPSPGLFWHGPC